MRIITHTCPSCRTIIAANELEDSRVMKCPGVECQEVLAFEDLPEEARDYFLEHRDQYQL
jgi:hypothetical protein